MTCEWSRAATSIATQLRADLVALEARARRRERWDNRSLSRALTGLLGGKGQTLLSYSIDHEVHATANALGLATPYARPELKARLDNKTYARALFADLGLPVPVWVAADRDWSPARLRQRLGTRLVAQPLVGSSGHGVRLVGPGDVRLRAGERELVSAWCDGPVINLHVAVDGDTVLVSPPSVQASGVPALGGEALAYGGNDFGAVTRIDSSVFAQVQRAGRRIGERVAAVGWRGMLGLDAIYDGSKLHFLEINPRMQGSSWLLAESQAEATAPVLGAAYRRLVLDGEPLPSTPLEGDGVEGAFVILRASSERPPPGRSLDGVYHVSETGLTRRRSRQGLQGLTFGEVVVDGTAEYTIAAGGVIARVASRTSLVGADGCSLTPFGERVVAALDQELATSTPASGGDPSGIS